MSIDYSRYSLEDLLDVKENIDAGSYPERYNQLLVEIEKRKKARGPKFEVQKRHFWDREEDDFEFIIEFKRDEKVLRFGFIALIIAINVWIVSAHWPEYQPKVFDSLQANTVKLRYAECNTHSYRVDGQRYRQHDLFVSDDTGYFVAYDLSRSVCERIAKTPTGEYFTVWHDEGIIYQLSENGTNRISYRTTKDKLNRYNYDFFDYAVYLVILWLVVFKSFLNAVFPGSFYRP